MKIVIFGTGRYLANRWNLIRREDEVVAFIDNGVEKENFFFGKRVVKPERILGFEFDIVLLMAKDRVAMRDQLLSMNVPSGKIWYIEQYKAAEKSGMIRFLGHAETKESQRLLIITEPLNHNGGAMAAFHAAVALNSRGYSVYVMAQYADPVMAKEMSDRGICVVEAPALPYMGEEELNFVRLFEEVIVNVFPMMRCACEVGRVRPVLWWLHEPSDRFASFYENTRFMHWQYDNSEWMKQVRIAGVSRISKRNFEQYYPDMVKDILPFGIPDEAESSLSNQDVCNAQKNIMVFSVIGGLEVQKGQVDVIEAFNGIDDLERGDWKLYLIGPVNQPEYARKVYQMIEGEKRIEYTGSMDREKLKKAYSDIDVVICASNEETMSMTIVEGMMNSKICITTTQTGIADYIEDGLNGYICDAGNPESLRAKILNIMKKPEKLGDVRKKARETYEKYFSMGVFADRLEKLLVEVKAEWKEAKRNQDHA